MATPSLAHLRTVPDQSTRDIRVDYEFLGLLNEAFGSDFFSLNQSFMGVPAAPKKQAIALREWAIHLTRGDALEAGRALRAWAKKHGKGRYALDDLEGEEARQVVCLYSGMGENRTLLGYW